MAKFKVGDHIFHDPKIHGNYSKLTGSCRGIVKDLNPPYASFGLISVKVAEYHFRACIGKSYTFDPKFFSLVRKRKVERRVWQNLK